MIIGAVRSSGLAKGMRIAAWGLVAAGIAAPLLRRRLGLQPQVVTTASLAAPIALCVAVKRSPGRDVGAAVLQMWGYLAHYEMPNDDPEKLAARVRIDYPIRADKIIGLGTLPGLRLQRALARDGAIRRHEAALVWAHWVWFAVPHGTVAYMLVRRRDRFARTAAHIYAVFDLGLVAYWAVPTAPPWYAARQGRADADLRRMMVEHGEAVWKQRWKPLYGFLGGNPLAAMPSLHFATSVMAAHMLAETGPVAGAVGWTYALTLGFALVYLGEHYVIDLLAGLALTEGVRSAAPAVIPAAKRLSSWVQRLEALAQR
jgi:membrane-associated phospholipid phosphatase